MQRPTIIGSLLALLAVPVVGDDWPEWRGKGRSGEWHEEGLLESFPEAGLRYSWRVPVRSGYGGPAVAQGRVFVTDFERRAGNRGEERVLALDEETGSLLWIHAWEVDLAGLMPAYANGPRATPTVDGDRLYVLGATGRLWCLRSADGGLVWSRDFVADFAAEVPSWGMVGAPLVDGERLVALVGGEPDALAVAFDKRTGEEVWRSLETVSEPGYAPPVMAEVGGSRQLIIWHPTAVVALEPESGRPLWQEPYRVDMGQTIATPVIAGNRLLVSSSSHGSSLLLLDAETATAKLAWKGRSSSKTAVDGLHAFLSTPFIVGDYIYGIGGLGYLRCIDARTGAEVWKTLEPSEDARIATAFLVKNRDRFFINNDRGELILARVSPLGYEEIDRTVLIEPTTPSVRIRRQLGRLNWVHPAYANGHVVTRNDEEIVRASLRSYDGALGPR